MSKASAVRFFFVFANCLLLSLSCQAYPWSVLVVPEYDNESLASEHRAYRTVAAQIEDALVNEFGLAVYAGNVLDIDLSCQKRCDSSHYGQTIAAIRQANEVDGKTLIDLVIFYHIISKDLDSRMGTKKLTRVSVRALDIESGKVLVYDDGGEQQAEYIDDSQNEADWVAVRASLHARDVAAYVGERLDAYQRIMEYQIEMRDFAPAELKQFEVFLNNHPKNQNGQLKLTGERQYQQQLLHQLATNAYFLKSPMGGAALKNAMHVFFQQTGIPVVTDYGSLGSGIRQFTISRAGIPHLYLYLLSVIALLGLLILSVAPRFYRKHARASAPLGKEQYPNSDPADLKTRNVSASPLPKRLIGLMLLTMLTAGLWWVNRDQVGQTIFTLLADQQAPQLASSQMDADAEQDPVSRAQTYLNKLGYRTAVNGILDQRTELNIRAFERDQGLVELGAVDRFLLSALSEAIEKQLAEAQAVADEAARKEQQRQRHIALVTASQAELNRIGYQLGTPNGTAGQETIEAIIHYQTSNVLTQTGKVSAALLEHMERARAWRSAGTRFKDCKHCPKMVVIAAGTFQMGSALGNASEQPVHQVTIQHPFAMSQYEVTWNDYQHCLDAGACVSVGDEGQGSANHPVINVSWNDAQNYTSWLSNKTGKHYRLPSEAEWEYAARANNAGHYSWGASIRCSQANYGQFEGRYDGPCGSGRNTVPVGSYRANDFGLYDMHGNVQEWVQDCWRATYRDAANTGQAWERAGCSARVMRGGAWSNRPEYLRSASRDYNSQSIRESDYGFRLARDM